MQRAQVFFFVSSGLLCLALAYHFTALPLYYGGTLEPPGVRGFSARPRGQTDAVRRRSSGRRKSMGGVPAEEMGRLADEEA